MSARPSAAVVIPGWNSLRHLARCLASVEEQGGDVELMVVDNGSSDGSVAFLEEKGVPHVALPRNTGFAAAVNLGAQRTRAPAILALNADTVLEPGCLAALVAALEESPSLGGVQPLILQLEGGDLQQEGGEDTEPPRVYSAGQALTADGRGIELAAGEVRGPQHLTRREVFGACGAACLLRRELFDRLGGYDESYFAFCEDVDLNVRARIGGWGFELVPEAVVWHVGNATWQSGFSNPGADNARLVARNRLATQVKFMPPGAIPRIAAVEVGALAKAARQRRFVATARGKLEALRRWGQLREERRNLRQAGDPGAARAWLGRR
ncbi:MAG TPA: glycosyltransferase family 2 protein [Solirubrobacterales bacterium]|nr:glycosyltransferase family 2 protein [Solirubrobacterales bacterium]